MAHRLNTLGQAALQREAALAGHPKLGASGPRGMRTGSIKVPKVAAPSTDAAAAAKLDADGCLSSSAHHRDRAHRTWRFIAAARPCENGASPSLHVACGRRRARSQSRTTAPQKPPMAAPIEPPVARTPPARRAWPPTECACRRWCPCLAEPRFSDEELDKRHSPAECRPGKAAGQFGHRIMTKAM